MGGIAQLNNRIPAIEVVNRETEGAEAELSQRLDYTGGIVLSDPDPRIKVTGQSGQAMRRYRIAADDQEPNVIVEKQSDKLVEVLIQLHRHPHTSAGGGPQRPRCALSVSWPTSSRDRHSGLTMLNA